VDGLVGARWVAVLLSLADDVRHRRCRGSHYHLHRTGGIRDVPHCLLEPGMHPSQLRRAAKGSFTTASVVSAEGTEGCTHSRPMIAVARARGPLVALNPSHAPMRAPLIAATRSC
jgi:hypothetical protein